MRSILVRSGLVAVGSAVASVLVASTVMAAQGLALDGNGLAMSILCPLLIAWPASAYNFRQRRRLAEANASLLRAHADLAEAHARLAERASRDAMTGMLNRESFLDAIRAEQAQGGSGAFLIIDADHFKRINDTHGHQIGDAALVEIAAAILRAPPRGSIVGRIGGEEFAAYVPDCRGEAVEVVAEEIRRSVEAIGFAPAGRNEPLSVSIGVAVFTEDLTIPQILRIADRRLYRAKRAGRNRVVADDSDDRAAA